MLIGHIYCSGPHVPDLIIFFTNRFSLLFDLDFDQIIEVLREKRRQIIWEPLPLCTIFKANLDGQGNDMPHLIFLDDTL